MQFVPWLSHAPQVMPSQADEVPPREAHQQAVGSDGRELVDRQRYSINRCLAARSPALEIPIAAGAVLAEHGRLGDVKPEDDASILGPAPAPFEKLEGNWRFHLILKGSKVSTLVRWLVAVRKLIKPGKGIKIDVDIDPLSML